MHFGKQSWRSFGHGIEREWLVTNGIGGYASSTLINANTRKYHGLLVAAHNPPGWRVVQLAKLDERYSAGGVTYNLAANETGYGITDSGFIHLQQVRLDPFPTFIYSFSDITLRKTVFMRHGQNTTVVLYQVDNGLEPAVLQITPLINSRGYHFMTAEGQVDFRQQVIPDGVSIRGLEEIPPLRLLCGSGSYVPGGHWFRGIAYAAERERGEPCFEDNYIPGQFEVEIGPGKSRTFALVATVDPEIEELDGEALLAEERARVKALVDRAGYDDPLVRTLVRAADAFIVERRATGTKTVIAGYPWFTDWGRDTMIALPGLTLVTGRFDDAREILLTFARQCCRGLIPNSFKIGAQDALYNTVDASLWYFQAVYKFLQYTKDFKFIKEIVFPVLKEITESYRTGTDYDIRMDEDGLIAAGSPDIQLTWMDAKVGEWVVTPRHGKAVEINALWYNALNVLELLCRQYGDPYPYPGLPERTRESFQRLFWNEREGYLCDVVVSEQERDCRLRPNQLLAASLPYSMLSTEQGKRVVHRVWQKLYATYGIRSLGPDDPVYSGVYIGDRVQRDGSYHQGTTWSWLMGPFITAYRKTHAYSVESRRQAANFIHPFRDHLRDHGVGYISEIFDGNDPVTPRGCIAQAWGVAEVLRAYVEDVLQVGPEPIEK
ncbi:MAG: glycogen debranching protein [Desulforudis sp.]|nr:MAG: glycogen debranching protein [Desulforudis sp.]